MARAHMTRGTMDPLPAVAAEADADEEADPPTAGMLVAHPASRAALLDVTPREPAASGSPCSGGRLHPFPTALLRPPGLCRVLGSRVPRAPGGAADRPAGALALPKR